MAKLLTPSNLKAIRFELKGLDEYLERIQTAGKNIEAAVSLAVEESAKPIHEDIRDWAEKHSFSGDTLTGVAISEVERDGNRFSVEVGIDSDISPNSWHAVFVEYGTPQKAADPGIREAFSNKARTRKIQRDILKREGMPIG